MTRVIAVGAVFGQADPAQTGCQAHGGARGAIQEGFGRYTKGVLP